MDTPNRVTEIAQKIQDLYFENGAIVDIQTWEKTKALVAEAEARVIAEKKEKLVEQIRLAIQAQEAGIHGLSVFTGFWGSLPERAIKLDALDGQKQLLRFIEKGYFPALETNLQALTNHTV